MERCGTFPHLQAHLEIWRIPILRPCFHDKDEHFLHHSGAGLVFVGFFWFWGVFFFSACLYELVIVKRKNDYLNLVVVAEAEKAETQSSCFCKIFLFACMCVLLYCRLIKNLTQTKPKSRSKSLTKQKWFKATIPDKTAIYPRDKGGAQGNASGLRLSSNLPRPRCKSIIKPELNSCMPLSRQRTFSAKQFWLYIVISQWYTAHIFRWEPLAPKLFPLAKRISSSKKRSTAAAEREILFPQFSRSGLKSDRTLYYRRDLLGLRR